MPSILDQNPYPWMDSGAQQLHRVLIRLYPTPQLATWVAAQAGIDQAFIDAQQPPIWIWYDILDLAAKGGFSLSLVTKARDLSKEPKLRPFLDDLLADRLDPGMWWVELELNGPEDLQHLRERRERPAPPYLATVRDIHARTTPLVGRQQELAEIAEFATGSGGYRWLVGSAWTGKTALLAEAATDGLPNDLDVVCYFLSRRAADADSNRFLAAAVPQLAHLCQRVPPAATAHEFTALWEQASQRAAGPERHLLLIVDGLDEDLRPPGTPSAAALLPASVGAWVHVLVSSRPFPELPTDIPDRHPLRATTPALLLPFAGAPELKALAVQELDDMLRRDADDLAVELLGLLTAAAGPLAVTDLAVLTTNGSGSAAHRRHVRQRLERAARSLEPVGPAGERRYQFAHETLLEYAKTHEDLDDQEYRARLDGWAEQWRAAGWPSPAEPGEASTPLYLLDSYPATLTHDGQQLTRLVADVGWVDAAVQAVGVDRVLADLRSASSAAPGDAVATLLATVDLQAINLRPPRPVRQPGYVLRQLALQALEMTETALADSMRDRLHQVSPAGIVPSWTTRRTSRALSAELGAHDAAVYAVAVLPDGRVVSGDNDGRVRLWDPAQPGVSVDLGRERFAVLALAVLPDGRVISGSHHWLLLWDPAQPGVSVDLGDHGGWINALAVLPDGRVVSGGDVSRVRLWDPAQPGVPVTRGSVLGEALAVLPDGRVVASGGWDRRVQLWDPAQPDVSVDLGVHDSWVRAVAVLPDGRVASGDDDGRVRLWDPAQPDVSVDLGHHGGRVNALAVLSDGRVASGGSDGRVRLWDPAQPGASVDLGVHDSWVRALAVLPDGRVASGGSDGRVRLWDPAQPGASGDSGEHDDVGALAVLSDGRVVSGGGDDGRVRLWDPTQPGASVDLGAHGGRVNALAVLSDGRLASGGSDGRVRLWDPAQPDVSVELGAHGSWVYVLAVLPDGRVVSGGHDGRVLLWDPGEPGVPVDLGAHDSAVDALAVLPDGRLVSGGNDGGMVVWRIPSGSEQEVSCSVTATAVTRETDSSTLLVVAHRGAGVSGWSCN